MAMFRSAGKALVRYPCNLLKNIARDRGYKKMIMHARKTALGFYEKLGYKKTGNEFFELPFLTL